jgi:hypothetical protein
LKKLVFYGFGMTEAAEFLPVCICGADFCGNDVQHTRSIIQITDKI